MTGRERCDRLKAIRAALASRLGIDLHQVECTFEGECSGTCPKCKQEEDALNEAILHKGAAAAGAMLLATSMTACVPIDGIDLNPFDNGGTITQRGGDELGYIEYLPDDDKTQDDGPDIETLTGEVADPSLDDGRDIETPDDKQPLDDDKVVEPIEIEDLTGYVAP